MFEEEYVQFEIKLKPKNKYKIINNKENSKKDQFGDH